jgi:glutamate/tyrosine decarboxylase-like PLP-dependent enzyme
MPSRSSLDKKGILASITSRLALPCCSEKSKSEEGFLMNGSVPGFPEKGLSRQEVLAAMEEARGQDFDWRRGRLFSTVYPVDQEIYELLKDAFNLFFTENGLNPTVFPSLRKFENEVVAMTASLLGGDQHVVGNMTLGGSESLLLAVKTARDWARVHLPP